MKKTRIRIESSELKTEYVPEYKHWLFGWVEFDNKWSREVLYLRFTLDIASNSLKDYTEEWAKKIIDIYTSFNKAKADKNKHKDKKSVSYIDYP